MAANLRFLMSSVIVCMIKSSLSIVTARDLNAEDYDDLSQGITNATFLDEEEDETRLWKAHGWLMAAAWGVMVPLAVGASLLRSWLPEGLWFRLHLALNAIAMFCVFAGFGIAVHVFSDHNEKHFVEFQHRKMGLVVFLLAVLQLVGGIVRPGLPQPNTSDATTSVPDNIDTVGKEETPPMPPTKKSLFRSIWEYTHRALGIGSLALAWWTCDSGLQLYNQEFGGEEYTAAFWGVTGGLAGVIAILTVFAKFGGSK